jgi:hypothetical protein
MLFLNMGLLLGLAGISIPVIIHLFNRRKSKILDWGAMRFLLESLASRRRRILLEEVLLLATRCMLLALLVLAMARPFIPAASRIPWLVILPLMLLGIAMLGVSFALWQYPIWRKRLMCVAAGLILLSCLTVALEKWLNLRRFGGRGHKDVALIIDGSNSMTMTLEGKTNFERALEEARMIIHNAPRKTAFSILLGGPSPSLKTPGPITDHKELMTVLDGLRPAQGSMGAVDAMYHGAISLAQGQHPSKQIVVLTDGQRTGWDIDSPSSWMPLAQAFKALPTSPQMVIRQLELPPQYRNAALADIQLSRNVIGTDREVGITVHIENTGTEAVTPKAILLKIDEEEFSDSLISQLTPGAEETFKFSFRFKKPGPHILQARVVLEDDLPSDDRYVRVLHVVDTVRVLIVDGNPAGRFMDRAAAFSALAMAPSEKTTGDIENRPGDTSPPARFVLVPELKDAPAISDIESFDAYAVVVFADVPRIPAAAAEKLAKFVADGGGLLIGAGARSLPEFYNRWKHEERTPMLPATLESFVLIGDDRDAARLSLSTFSHDALRDIADESQSDMGSVRLSGYWRLKPRAMDADVSEGARLSTGEPWLMQRKLGEGVVLLVGSGLDAHGSNLATRQAFVPLVHELIYSLALPGLPRMHMPPGREVAFRLRVQGPGASATNAQGAIPRAGMLGPFDSEAVDPIGERRSAKVETRDGVFMAGILGDVTPGLYRLRLPDRLKGPMRKWSTRSAELPFSISRDVAESRLLPLEEADFAVLKKHGDVMRANSHEDVTSMLSGKAFGDELWKHLAVGALVLLLAEIALTRWIAVRRKTGHEASVDFETRMGPSASFREQLQTMRPGRKKGLREMTKT